MLKATDIRIGNHVLCDKQICTIQGIVRGVVGYELYLLDSSLNIAVRSIRDEAVMPVPITKKILDYCGFRHTKTVHDELITYGFNTTTEEYGLFEDLLNEYFNVTITTNSKDDRTAINCINKSGIEYLHELENAYWWANGEELPFEFAINHNVFGV